MMEISKKKESYKAPEMKATSFKAEQGYATSVTPTKSFSIGVGSSSL